MLKLFQITGYCEGASYLLLLFIAMPLKYIWDSPEWVRVIGMAHGILFLLYVGIATLLAVKMKWPLKTLLMSYAASVLPFGPFIFDRQLARSLQMEEV